MMSVEAILVWIVVGLVAGWLASMVVGSAFGILGDIIVGIVGAFLGGRLFHMLGLHVPLRGIPGTILVAFCGAVVLLLLLRLVFSISRR